MSDEQFLRRAGGKPAYLPAAYLDYEYVSRHSVPGGRTPNDRFHIFNQTRRNEAPGTDDYVTLLRINRCLWLFSLSQCRR